MDIMKKRWINIEKEATKGVAVPFWSVPSFYSIPQGYICSLKFISWICDITQTININNIKQYKANLHFDELTDEGVSFYMSPNFAQFPFPFRRVVDENKTIKVYFEASVALTFDYLVVRMSGWLIPKNIFSAAEEEKD